MRSGGQPSVRDPPVRPSRHRFPPVFFREQRGTIAITCKYDNTLIRPCLHHPCKDRGRGAREELHGLFRAGTLALSKIGPRLIEVTKCPPTPLSRSQAMKTPSA